MMRRISIVLPSFNTDRYLERSITAFLEQDCEQKHLFIVDGKSSDRSHEIISSFANVPELTWVKEADTGISNAINLALPRLNDTDVFGYLGADDILLPGSLSIVQKHFHDYPSAIGAFSDSYSQRMGMAKTLRRCPSENFEMAQLLKHITIAGLQNTYLRAGIVKSYGFEEAAKYAMDYEL